MQLERFNSIDDSARPWAILALVGFLWTIPAAAQPHPYTVLHSFDGYDGDAPYGGVTADSAGSLYGTTPYGESGFGGVFKLDPAGALTVLYAFTGGTDGGNPHTGVTRDSAGNLYGTTSQRAGNGCGGSGCGTVFKLDPQGNLFTLHTFTGGPDGGDPQASVIRDSDGNLYGTTFYGGTVCGGGCGVVFEIDTAGSFTVLHSFVGADGAHPNAGLILDSAGNLYGTASEGGGGGAGVVYRLDAARNFTVLHSFVGTDGSQPWGGLTLDSAGNLYGTTQYGGGRGCGIGCGVVFELSPDGALTVLYHFTGGTDGGQPYAGVVRDNAGNLYGTNGVGAGTGCGGMGCGVIYSLSLNNGAFTVLHRFTGAADGGFPLDGVMLRAGYLYGTTLYGGTYSGGVIFKVRKAPSGQ